MFPDRREAIAHREAEHSVFASPALRKREWNSRKSTRPKCRAVNNPPELTGVRRVRVIHQAGHAVSRGPPTSRATVATAVDGTRTVASSALTGSRGVRWRSRLHLRTPQPALGGPALGEPALGRLRNRLLRKQ
jgi:hypothetical protein